MAYACRIIIVPFRVLEKLKMVGYTQPEPVNLGRSFSGKHWAFRERMAAWQMKKCRKTHRFYCPAADGHSK
jgi:hypothetical protein